MNQTKQTDPQANVSFVLLHLIRCDRLEFWCLCHNVEIQQFMVVSQFVVEISHRMAFCLGSAKSYSRLLSKLRWQKLALSLHLAMHIWNCNHRGKVFSHTYIWEVSVAQENL